MKNEQFTNKNNGRKLSVTDENAQKQQTTLADKVLQLKIRHKAANPPPKKHFHCTVNISNEIME